MIPNPRPPSNHLLATILCFCLLATNLQAQTTDVCQEGDYSPTALAIQLDAPLQSSSPGATNTQRTEQDIAAWKENGFESSQRALNLKKRAIIYLFIPEELLSE